MNTLFEVIHQAGGYTAWSDKHQAYDLLSGPSGKGIDDLYAPEVNSLIVNGGVANGVHLADSLALCDGVTNSLPLSKVSDYTTCEPSIMAYDDVKVQAVINEVDGKTGDGTKSAPVPTILGMNFQQVSVGQKLPVGGYLDGNGTPSALLDGAIAHVDASLGRMVSELRARHLYDSTLIIVSAKHGQSPTEKAKLAMEPGGSGNATVTDPLGFINATDPNVSNVFAPFVNPNDGSSPVVDGWLMADDAGLVWLQDQSKANVAGVIAQLTDPAHAWRCSLTCCRPGRSSPRTSTTARSWRTSTATRTPAIQSRPRARRTSSSSRTGASLFGQQQEDRRARRRHARRHGSSAARLAPCAAPPAGQGTRLDQAGPADHPQRAEPGSPRSAGRGEGAHADPPRPRPLGSSADPKGLQEPGVIAHSIVSDCLRDLRAGRSLIAS